MKTDARATVEELLRTTDLLLTVERGVTEHALLRGASIALRTALELAVNAVLEESVSGLSKTSMRAKLLCLPSYVNGRVARGAGTTWSHLCLACHYHQYEMGPTHEQVWVWREEVEELSTLLLPR